MRLFKKIIDDADKVYAGKATFYHNNGESSYASVGSFTSEQISWIKSHIGRDVTFSDKKSSINLKYFFSVVFSFEEEN